MKLDLKRFEKDINEGFIVRREHPTHDIAIYNYTQKAMYENHWTEETKMCRGLVLDFKGNVVANPFEKFFNYGQQVDENPFEFPNEKFEVFEKKDGMLAILFYHKYEWLFATRGCFDSEYTEEIGKIWLKKYRNIQLDESKTYLAELISPLSKIILDYKGERDLVLIAERDADLGYETSYDDLCRKFPTWTKVKRYDLDIDSILKMDVKGEEGFVLLFESGKRLKVKFPEYVRLHAIISHLSSKTVWSYLKEGFEISTLFESVPDEIVEFVKRWATKLREEFRLIEQDCIDMWHKVQHLETRKEQAIFIKDYQYKSVVFKMLDIPTDRFISPEESKRYEKMIWEIVEPEREVPYEVED